MDRGIFVAILAAAVGLPQAYSADYPTRGTLSGIVEHDGLQFRCQKEDSEILSCDFTQVSIAPVREASEWPTEKQKILKNLEQSSYDQLSELQETMCSYSKKFEEQLADRAKAADERSGSRTAGKRGLQTKFAAQAKEFCSEPSVEHMMALSKLSFDRDVRTCRVTINNFSQRFKASSAGWSVISEPTGECGVVQLSKFEPDTEFFWRYTARKAITNPENETAFGMACSDFDEKPYPYTWEPAEKDVGCDFIRY